jgi:DtxR family transcriptional regulator, manganese transport regulator
MKAKGQNTGRRLKAPPSPSRMSPSISNEDYLERIHELIERTGHARVVDIAACLAVSQPSVTAMVKKLAGRGFLKYRKYRGLVMTDKGREVAQRIKNRHATLQRFLSLLGVDAVTQEQDIEGLEHCLSEATLQRLAELAAFFESRPDVLREFGQAKELADH